MGPLSRKAYHPVYGDLHKMRVRELGDARQLEKTAKDIISRRPTHKRRAMPEFRPAWRNDNDVLVRTFTRHLAEFFHEIRDSLDLTSWAYLFRMIKSLSSYSSSPLYEDLPQELPTTSPQRRSGIPPSPLHQQLSSP